MTPLPAKVRLELALRHAAGGKRTGSSVCSMVASVRQCASGSAYVLQAMRRQHSNVLGNSSLDHTRKRDDERLWLPDFIAGSYLGAVSGAGPEPWKIVSDSHIIEVISLDGDPTGL